jgi:hypothetical protein
MSAALLPVKPYLTPRRERDVVRARGHVRGTGRAGEKHFVEVEEERGVWRLVVDDAGLAMFVAVSREPLIEFCARPAIGEVFWVHGPPTSPPTFDESAERIMREDHEILAALAR